MANREVMEELEAARGPGWSTGSKLRLVGGLVILIVPADSVSVSYSAETMREIEGL